MAKRLEQSSRLFYLHSLEILFTFANGMQSLGLSLVALSFVLGAARGKSGQYRALHFRK